MALKDLKSDLSKFRMPKKDPLVNKKVESVNKKVNQTPLSSLIKSMSDVPKPNTNPTKKGTTPTKFDNDSNFLGETNPTKFDNDSNFLGETEPNKMDNSSNFLGETEPNKMDNKSNFLGETSVSSFDNSSNFLGETSVSSFDNSSNFLGETDANKMDNSPNFLGETDANKMDNSAQNLGSTDLKIQNNFSDIHAKGFTPYFDKIDDTKFVGIDPSNTIFDSANSKYSNFLNSFPGLSFTAGYQRFKPIGNYSGDVQRYNPDRKYYIDNTLTNSGISQLQDSAGSPSFLEKAYNKFNLKDDSFNTTIPFLNHPLILRGIQKKNGIPEDYGQFGLSFDDGFIRGGTISSTTRALVDTARIGSWLLSPKGTLWSNKQVGMQRLNKSNKIWTPTNLLTAVGSQHLGLKPKRHGLIPFAPTITNPINKLESIYINETAILTSYQFNTILPTQTDLLGGFDSFYGIGITTTTRYTNTFKNFAKVANHYKSGFLLDSGLTKQTINPVLYKTDVNTGYSPVKTAPVSKLESKPFVSVPTDDDEKKSFGLAGKLLHDENSIGIVPEVVQGKEKSNSEIDILKYETTVYGLSENVSRRDSGGFNDFRSKLSNDNVNKKIADKEEYSSNSLEAKYKFGNPGKVGSDRSDYNISDRGDSVNSLGVDSTLNNSNDIDLVNLWFREYRNNDTYIRFRSTISGLSETFSPSWDTIKYNGRADQGYKYSSFERSISFNFRIAVTSRTEMKPCWEKLQRLSTYTMAEYSEESVGVLQNPSDTAGYRGTLIRFRLGDLYNDKLAFIESLSYTMLDDTPWDINADGNLAELPMGVDVSIGLKILGDEIPQINSTDVYDWNF